MEPRPADIYWIPQVLNPLLKTKFRKLSTSTGPHSFPFGSAHAQTALSGFRERHVTGRAQAGQLLQGTRLQPVAQIGESFQ